MIINNVGEMGFKFVISSYEGARFIIRNIHSILNPTFYSHDPIEEDNHLWGVTIFSFLYEGLNIQSHPVRIYLFGHEGMGFIGQPRVSKEMVYKNNDAIVLFGNDKQELQDLIDVSWADFRSINLDPAVLKCFIAGPEIETVSFPEQWAEIKRQHLDLSYPYASFELVNWVVKTVIQGF